MITEVKMKVTVNRDNCIGCGACEAICPEVFRLDDEGISTVFCDDFSKVNEDEVTEAVEGCPTSAIEKVNNEK